MKGKSRQINTAELKGVVRSRMLSNNTRELHVYEARTGLSSQMFTCNRLALLVQTVSSTETPGFLPIPSHSRVRLLLQASKRWQIIKQDA